MFSSSVTPILGGLFCLKNIEGVWHAPSLFYSVRQTDKELDFYFLYLLCLFLFLYLPSRQHPNNVIQYTRMGCYLISVRLPKELEDKLTYYRSRKI